MGKPLCKITVLKRTLNKDFAEEYLKDELKICDVVKDGQEFIVDNHNCPPGFCNWAYADIQRDLVHILYGGYFPWMKEKGVAIACCTDGFRPVIFKIERIED